jgi:hypothetical protein
MEDQADTVPLWKRTHPEFEGIDFPLPEGFKDTSWQHDTCPSFQNKELGVQLFVDYANPEMREVKGFKRFTLVEYEDGEATDSEALAHTDDFAEVLTAIDERRAARAPKPA